MMLLLDDIAINFEFLATIIGGVSKSLQDTSNQQAQASG
jgi:hypothetical protein